MTKRKRQGALPQEAMEYGPLTGFQGLRLGRTTAASPFQGLSVLELVVSFLNHQERLRLAATCLNALQAVEAICQRKLKKIFESHKVDDSFEDRIVNFDGQGRSKTSNFRPRSHRFRLWAAMNVYLYKIEPCKQPENNVSMRLSESSQCSILAVRLGCETDFCLSDLLQKKTLGSLRLDSKHDVMNCFFHVGEYAVYCAYRKIYIFRKDQATNEYRRVVTHPVDQLVSAFVGPNENEIVIVDRFSWDTDPLVRIVSLSVVDGTVLSSHALDLGMHGIEKSTMLINHRWLLVSCSDRESPKSQKRILVYDLEKRRKVQYLDGDYGRFCSQSQNGTSQKKIFIANDREDTVYQLELDDAGYLSKRPFSFEVSIDKESGYVEFSVTSDCRFVVASDRYNCNVYSNETGEWLRRIPAKEHIMMTLACTYPHEVLVTYFQALPVAYCMVEPQV